VLPILPVSSTPLTLLGPFSNGDSISRCHCANRKGLEARTLTVFAGNAKLLCDQTGFSLTDDNDNVANRR
jgi:hypothetical protein